MSLHVDEQAFVEVKNRVSTELANPTRFSRLLLNSRMLVAGAGLLENADLYTYPFPLVA